MISALSRELSRRKADVLLHTEVKELIIEEGRAAGVLLSSGKKLYADAVIVASGGISYPSTGSTGDGYRFAESCGASGHGTFSRSGSDGSERMVCKRIDGAFSEKYTDPYHRRKKKLYEEFGEMLFTHYGVTGPVILSASSVVGNRLKQKELTLHIDLKPALSEEQLDKRVLREFEANHNRQFKNAVDSLFPAKLKPVMVELSEIPEDKKVHEITKEERLRFVRLIKDFTMTLTNLRGYNEAIITKGGVSVKEVDPGTMESKKVSGLYFAGEVLDLDAVTGGYNLQIAWSTGYLRNKCGRKGKELKYFYIMEEKDGIQCSDRRTGRSGKEYDRKAGCKGKRIYLCGYRSNVQGTRDPFPEKRSRP